MRALLIWIGVFGPIFHLVFGGDTRTVLGFNIVATTGLVLVFLSGQYMMAAMVYALAAVTTLKAALLRMYLGVSPEGGELICYLLAVCYGFVGHMASTRSARRLASRDPLLER